MRRLLLSSVPDHARAHLLLEIVDTFTSRAAQGVAECEHALALDRNLAQAHSIIGRCKIFVGRAEETEAHVAEALRLQVPAIRWLTPGWCKPAWRSCTLEQAAAWLRAGDRGQPKQSAATFCAGRRDCATRSN
jgi:hypothetical protein